jgi:hypothetical protein
MLVESVDERRVELICEECGYGVAVTTTPPTCPICGASSWDTFAWRPFGGLEALRADLAARQNPARG